VLCAVLGDRRQAAETWLLLQRINRLVSHWVAELELFRQQRLSLTTPAGDFFQGLVIWLQESEAVALRSGDCSCIFGPGEAATKVLPCVP